LGSNINPADNLVRAVVLLRQFTTIEAISMVWETLPSYGPGPHFYNTALCLQVTLTASLLKSLILRRVEVQLGRLRTINKDAPRTIDVDILVYDGQVVDPKIWEYAFMAVPLAELLPDLKHPDTQQSLRETANRLLSYSKVTPRPEVFRRLINT